jgi:hypothetical protein
MPNDTLQLPLAGMLAAASVTLLLVLVTDTAAPPQELEGISVPRVRPEGIVKVMPD